MNKRELARFKKLVEAERKRVFVKLDDFREALTNIELVKKGTKQLQFTFKNIDERSKNTNEKFEKYRGLLENLQKKLNQLDNKLLG